jgi:uncharacterized protein HemX
MATPNNNQAPHTTVNKTSGNGSGIIIGILVVLVIGFGFYFFSGGDPMDTTRDVNVNVEGSGDAVQGTAEPVEGAEEPAAGN